MLRNLGIAVALVLTAALGLWAAANKPLRTKPRSAASAPLPDAVAATPLPAPPRERPASLRGTEVSGALLADAAGGFLVTTDALDLFDYFLSASGEEPTSVIRDRIEREIRVRLPRGAQAEALDLLDRYLAYREALRGLHSEGLDAAALELRLQRIREVRRTYFDLAEREELFAEEEARWDVEIERRRVALDDSLSDAERAERLEELEAALPEAVRAARHQAMSALELRRAEAALRADGAGAGEIQALREDRVGEAAADRLEQLDQQRGGWSARVDQWRAEQAQLVAEGASPARIDAARAQHFDGPELLRVQALERIEAEAARSDTPLPASNAD